MLPASGWRLETEEKTDKEKSDFYFFTSRKKFLTEKIIGPLAGFPLGHDGDLEQSSPENFPLNFAVPPSIMRDRNGSKMSAAPAFSIRLASWLTIFALAAVLSLRSLEAAPRRNGRITHVVLFWLKRPGNVDDQNVLIRAVRSFRRMKGISEVRVGRSLPVEQSFDVGVVITFKNAGALKKFERNQRHQQIIETALRPFVRRYIVYNFSSE